MSRGPSHYDTLGVTENCTSKDIKTAYVTLSKLFHPDKSPDNPGHKEKFIKIHEAYTVLSKPQERRLYDLSLRYNFNPNLKVVSSAPRWRDTTIWSMRNKEEDQYYANRPYYGIPGIKRVSNLWIAGGALVIMTIGIAFHYVAIKYLKFKKRFKKTSATFTVKQLNLRDERIGKDLRNTRNVAFQNGNELQIEILRNKLDAGPED